MFNRLLAGIAGILLLALGGCASAPPAAAPAPPPTSASAGETTIVAIQPARGSSGPGPIGRAVQAIGGGLRRVGQAVRNRLGMRFPGLESKPALTAITDPSNSGPDADPAAQAAAEIKAAEDGADQKVKALRYLGRIGCGGCYPGVEEAYLSALEDCTEEVRYEAVKAIRSSGASPCKVCAAGSCCSPTLLKKLNAIGNEQNDRGCYIEPSARVRRLARICVANCGGYVETAEATEAFPAEGPPATTEEGDGANELPPPAAAASPAPAASNHLAAESVRSLPMTGMLQPVDFKAIIPQSQRVVARVAGDTIMETELLLAYVTRHPRQPAPQRLEELPSQTAIQLTEEAVRRKLLAHEAVRRMPAERLAALLAAAFPHKRQPDPLERERVMADAWLKQVKQPQLRFSSEMLQQRFEAEFAHRQVPAQARWELIWVDKEAFRNRTEAYATIEHTRQKALGLDSPPPQGFQPDRIQFAVRPWTALPSLPKPQRAALEQLAPGAVSGIVEDANRFMVLRLLERRAPRPVTLNDVRGEVEAALKRDMASRFDDIYVEQLRNQSEVWTIFTAGGAPPATTTFDTATIASPPQ